MLSRAKKTVNATLTLQVRAVLPMTW